jgi:hypothetical protein
MEDLQSLNKDEQGTLRKMSFDLKNVRNNKTRTEELQIFFLNFVPGFAQ